MSNLSLIKTHEAPEPGGHYSQAVVYGGLVYVSGLLPVTVKGEKITGNIEDQFKLVLKNMENILKAAGSSKDKVLKTVIYISDIKWWDSVNEIYAGFFEEHKPARAIVPVKTLHHGFSVELEATAAVIQ